MSQPASFPSPGGQAENQGTAAFAADPIQTQNGGADAPASSKNSKKKGKKTVTGPRRVRQIAKTIIKNTKDKDQNILEMDSM